MSEAYCSCSWRNVESETRVPIEVDEGEKTPGKNESLCLFEVLVLYL
jgi:hypothetical protein